jgi:hypothetical protein
MPNFPIPKGFSMPDGIKEGDEFSEIATFKIEDGKVHVMTLGEKKTPVMDKEEKAAKPKGGKQAISEQLRSMEDKDGSDEMQDTGGEK